MAGNDEPTTGQHSDDQVYPEGQVGDAADASTDDSEKLSGADEVNDSGTPADKPRENQSPNLEQLDRENPTSQAVTTQPCRAAVTKDHPYWVGVLSGTVTGVVSGIIAGVIVALVWRNVTTNWADEQRGRTLERPLSAFVTNRETAPEPSFSMVIPPSAPLPAPTELGPDCDDAWKMGLAAGGVPIGHAQHNILLTTTVESGVIVKNLRAVVNSRDPAPDGVLLQCGLFGGGSVDASEFFFDLTTSDSVYAMRPPDPSGGPVQQFDDGQRIHVTAGPGTPVTLNITTVLPPNKAVKWHIEADLHVSGEDKTVPITFQGSDFHGSGLREGWYTKTYGMDSAFDGANPEQGPTTPADAPR